MANPGRKRKLASVEEWALVYPQDPVRVGAMLPVFQRLSRETFRTGLAMGLTLDQALAAVMASGMALAVDLTERRDRP